MTVIVSQRVSAKFKKALRAADAIASASPIGAMALCQARSPISLRTSASPSWALRIPINEISGLALKLNH
jgi:hypothetical protein